MKKVPFFFLFLLLLFTANAQVETIVYDGVLGITQDLENDSLVIREIAETQPAENAGLMKGDIILEVNGKKISGAGLSTQERDNVMSGAGGTLMEILVKRPGVDSLLSISLLRDISLSIDPECYYEYLVDSSDKWTIRDIVSDSIQALFSNVMDNNILVHTVQAGGTGEEIGLKPGDKLIGLADDMYLWDLLDRDEYYSPDTQLVWLRDSVRMQAGLNGRKQIRLGIETRYGHDLSQENLWIKMVFNNQIATDRTYLLNIGFPYDSIFLYQLDGTGSWYKKKTGGRVSRKEKDLVLWDMNAFKIELKKQEHPTAYINIINRDGVQYPPVIYLEPYDEIIRYDHFERFLVGAILGIIFIAALYYFILFFYMKDFSHLSFIFYILSFGLLLLYTSAYGNEFIWNNSAILFMRLSIIIYPLPIIFFLLFGLTYLNLKGKLRTWYWIVWGNLIFMILTASALLLSELNKPFYLTSPFGQVVGWIHSAFVISSLLILFIPSVIRIKQGFKPAWYLIAANIIFLALALYHRFSSTDIFSSMFSMIISEVSVYLTVIVQFLLFSLGLGQKMRSTEKARQLAQKKMIEQLRENEKLKDKVNLELEQKVNERTQEILMQKEEIEAQRDEMEKQRDELTEQKQEITDSINYAKRIQSAVLPTEELLHELLPEHFVLFKPRDIVSGDFYWLRQIKHFTVVVAADCTGHGVPGAFMSMLGISFLNELISRSRFDNAGEFLDRMRKKVKETMKQEGKQMEQKDGMDMSLAIIDNDTMELQYAGAFNPLFIFRKRDVNLDDYFSELVTMTSDQHNLIEIKGDRQPIAIHDKESDFKTHCLKLEKGDTIYIFSDGYPDQMGGPKGKKFMITKFKQMLLDIQPEPLAKQKEILDQTLEEWKGDIQQIDDILVFGIRWK